MKYTTTALQDMAMPESRLADFTSREPIEQLRYRLDFNRLCYDRAMERCDYDAAGIFHARAEWLEGQITKKGQP